MNKQLFILLSLVILFFTGCGNNSKKPTPTTEHTFNTIKITGGKTLLCNEFDSYLFVGIKDSCLITKAFGYILFETYKIKGDSLKKDKRFGRKGQGPKEFNTPLPYFDTKQNKLFVVDNYSALGNGCIIDMKNKNFENSRNWKSFSLRWMKSFYGGVSFIAENNNELLFLGGFPKESSLLSQISISNKTSKAIDFWYKNPYIRNNHRINQSVFLNDAHIFKNNTNNKILYCGGNGKVVSLFKIKNNKVDSLLHIYNEVSPNKTADGLNYYLTKDENWQVFAKATDQFFYLRPYKYDKRRSNYKGYPFYYSDRLEVYDWNGKHITNMEFDTPFYDFIIDENNTFVFTLTTDLKTDDIIVRKYNINKIF